MRNGKNKLLPSRRWKQIWGLTGGFGSGKSTVLHMLKKKGAFTVDADAIVQHLLSKKGPVLREIRAKFGKAVFDNSGKLMRPALALRVFGFPRKRKILERIIHPRVRETIRGELTRHAGRVAILDIPLLYEAGWQKQLDGVIVVKASLRDRLDRLRRRGFSKAEAKRRIRSQMSLKQKARQADCVIDNNGTLENTRKQVEQIWEKIINVTHGGH